VAPPKPAATSPDQRACRGQITDPAPQGGVTHAYVCRLLPLTCLAPGIVEALLDGRQPKGLRLADMLGNGPLAWEEQRRAFGSATQHNHHSAAVRSSVCYFQIASSFAGEARHGHGGLAAGAGLRALRARVP
jgi:hypothetical protein